MNIPKATIRINVDLANPGQEWTRGRRPGLGHQGHGVGSCSLTGTESAHDPDVI